MALRTNVYTTSTGTATLIASGARETSTTIITVTGGPVTIGDENVDDGDADSGIVLAEDDVFTFETLVYGDEVYASGDGEVKVLQTGQ